MILEVCVDSVASALAAQEGGADRVELCADLAHGGTTPDMELVAAVRRRISIALAVMIRLRAGNFLYSSVEFETMKEEVRRAKDLHADVVVFGMLTSSGSIDVNRVRQLVDLARPLQVTFNRAFDECPDLPDALEDLKSIGIERVLTSGGATSVSEGKVALSALVRRAKGEIGVMAGGGITFENISEIVRFSGIDQVHALSALLADRSEASRGGDRSPNDFWSTDPAKVRRMVSVLSAL